MRATRALGGIHGQIRVPQQFLGRAAITREAGDANAGVEPELLLARQCIGTTQVVAQVFGDARGGGGIGAAGEDRDEFVTADARDQVALAQAALQSLADCITIEEFKLKKRPKVVLTWLPHFKALPQAVANSFCEWMNPMDVDLVITHPEGYDLSPEFVGKGQVIYDQDKALEGADFVYGKNWSSYNSYGQVLTADPSWMITEAKMALTDNGKFMHCLPVRRNMKVADEVLDGPRSLVIEQAANREWSAQAALKEVLLGL